MTTSELFFEALKSHRESQNIEIQDICEYTKIHPQYIQAIESGDFTVLPNVYMRLFLRSYANFISADSAKALEDYEMHTTGKVQKKTELKIAPISEKKVERESAPGWEQDYQITPKRIATIAAVGVAVILIFQLANRVTQEQVKDVDIANLPAAESVLSAPPPSVDGEIVSPESGVGSEVSVIEENYAVDEKIASALPNRLPLNKNDFTLEKKIREVTETVHLSPPYTITIHTLSETKLNLSKYSNGELTALINDVVESGEMFSFGFDSTLNFDLWSGSQVQISLNNTSINDFLGDDDLAVRGSFEARNNQLYLGFYRH